MNFSDFDDAMKGLPEIPDGTRIAAGVSGGPDSMAMLWLLSRWAEKRGIVIDAYTVDHALRAESAQEAQKVGAWIKGWPCVSHTILRWDGDKPDSRILEEARFARYDLMAQAMGRSGAHYLFIAHHADDQAETFLIRLAKGSGLDGLSCMKPSQKMESSMTVLRPLLAWSKDDLVKICRENNIPYVDDPTNKNEHYLRPRLRAAKEILEEEGLSAKRLCMTARRISRAREALEAAADSLFGASLVEQGHQRFLFDYKMLQEAHEELALRVILKAMNDIHPDDGYGPRLEKVESLLERILHDPDFKGATLGGCMFRLKTDRLMIEKE